MKMPAKTQMSLIKAIIKSNYKNQLLTLLSNLNTVHIKSKEAKKLKIIEEDRPFADQLKNLRQSLNTLFKIEKKLLLALVASILIVFDICTLVYIPATFLSIS